MSPSLVCLLLILSTMQGMSGQEWEVILTHNFICAVTGSSVVMPCSFTHPPGLTVTNVYWVKNMKHGVPPPDLLHIPQYAGRVQYSPDMERNCTLTLSDVRVTDTGFYYVRIETESQGEQSLSSKVSLTIKDIAEVAVHSSGPAIEGREGKLSCESRCILGHNSKILWRKDGNIVPGNQTNNNELILPSIKIEDEGDYSCAIEGREDHPSPPLKLKVFYPPKVTVATVNPSAYIEGDSVTLTCSSDANPPANIYVWIKGSGFRYSVAGTKQIYKITKISSVHSDYYYCVAKNQHGQRSSKTVYVAAQYAPRNTSASVSPSGEIVEGTLVTLTCSSDANPPVQSYTWYKRSESGMSVISRGQVYSIISVSSEHTGDYYCEAANNHAYTNSTVIHLNVLNSPRGTIILLNHTGLLNGSSVTLSCSSDANPPVENYTWHRRNGVETTAVGSGETITFTLTSTTAGLYYCEAKNRIGKSSASVKVFLTDAPKHTSASVSPSGEIVGGTSVTLTCSSDANPSVQSYTWYRRSESGMFKIVAQQNYSISDVSSEHTGYYHCQAENKHGHNDSTEVHLNVLYAPKGTLASFNHTDHLVKGTPVTLSCRSDANPPVENYTWYRRTGVEITAVGSGETITFTLTSTTAGLYHCEAKNRIGTSASIKVSLAVSGGQGVAVIAGGCGAVFMVVIVMLAVILSRRRKTASNSTGDSVRRTQAAADNDYVNANPVTSDPVQSADADDPDDVQYASVQFKSSRGQQVPPHSTAQRSSPSRPHNHQAIEEVEYATVNFSRPTAATNTSADGDFYSTVNTPRR